MRRAASIATACVILASCSQVPVPASEVGRYVVVPAAATAQAPIMIDTVTGQTWTLVQGTDHDNWWAAMRRQSATDPKKFEGEK